MLASYAVHLLRQRLATLLALSFRGLGRLPMLALVVFGVLGLHALWVGAPPMTSRDATIHPR